MSEDDKNTGAAAENSSPVVSNPVTKEFIAFDLGPVRDAHPEHATVIERISERANPPLTWGILSTADLLETHFADTTAEEQLESNVWLFSGETAEQRDQRIIEDFRLEMIDYAAAAGGNENLAQILRDVRSAYYLVTFTKGAPGTKVLKA